MTFCIIFGDKRRLTYYLLIHNGDISRNFLTTSGSTSITYLISSSVFSRLSESLYEPCACSGSKLIASKTCDGSSFFDEQAESVEAAIPLSLRRKIKDSPSIPVK